MSRDGESAAKLLTRDEARRTAAQTSPNWLKIKNPGDQR
jgi:hypothetical protein